MNAQIAEYCGYLASVCLILSLIATSDVKFRWYNAAGTVFFIVYAVLLKAYPVLLTNGILFLINVFYLIKIYRRKENFAYALFKSTEELPLQYVQHYSKEIAEYFPQFSPDFLEQNINLLITRDLAIANLFSAKLLPNGDAIVQLNFTLARYRDYKVGNYLFESEKEFLLSKGVRRIVYEQVAHKGHLDFIKRNGFVGFEVNGQPCYVKNLA